MTEINSPDTGTSKPLLFFDIEVFKYDRLIVFKDIDKNLVASFWNDFEGVYDVVKGKQLIGYNSYRYDDYIVTAMINGWTQHQIKELNDTIISGNTHGKIVHQFLNDSLDCFQQIDVSMPSLKKIEGNMGRMILESSVDFNIDRPLTEEEKRETEIYCSYDVDTTIDVYKLREHSYFTSKKRLVDMLGNPKALKWNTTTTSAQLLLKKPLPKWSDIRVPEWMMNLVPPEVREMWEKKSKDMDGKIKPITVREFGCEIQFGFGGLHGVHETKKRVENLILADVALTYWCN